MARRSEHSLEELKALVLDAAETIVIDEGFSELKVRKIAMEIGYTVGSIYMVFANMADLIMHINARTLDALAAQLEQIQDMTLSSRLNRWPRLIYVTRVKTIIAGATYSIMACHQMQKFRTGIMRKLILCLPL